MREKYESLSAGELREVAKARGLKGISALRKDELVQRMLEEDAKEQEKQIEDKKAEFGQLDSGIEANGILEVLADGYGFIRSDNYMPGENDVYVSPSQIRRFNLKTGDIVRGSTRVRKENEKFGALLYVTSINGMSPNENTKRYSFEDMTTIFPDSRLRLERPGGSMAMRIVDLISPIGKGQRGMIVSPPKAGKTTLLKMLGGIEKPSAGSIFYTNKELYQCKESEMEGYRRKEIGFIFQDYRLLDEMTVRENILVPQILDGARSTIAERKMKKLTKVLGISEKKDYYPYELSGGEKQRVAICRALINEPKVILADEPTGNLDTFNTELILEILLRIKIELKKTIILVTHDKGICKFADRIIEMKNGKLQEQNIK